MTMPPTTPDYKFGMHMGPSSPPATPTAGSFNAPPKNRRHGIPKFSHNIATPRDDGRIIPTGDGTTFSYNPFQALDQELSPRSSTSVSSDGDGDSLRPRSRSPSPASLAPSPPRKSAIPRLVKDANFTIEEFDEDDMHDDDDDDNSVIYPYQIEDAASERARSTKGTSPNRDIDPQILHGISKMCSPGSNNDDQEEAMDEREIWLAKLQEEKRRKRRSSIISKRSIKESLGSDSDGDYAPVFVDGVNELGSSARRLRRKVAGERTSIILFDDPPPRIEEELEPESCEELVSAGSEEGLRHLPYYVMDVDSDEDDD